MQFSGVLQLASTVVRIPSVSGNWEGQRAVQEALSAALPDAHLRRGDSPRPWTLLTVGKPKALFVCHTDTVPLGGEWPGFSGLLDDRFLHGRGSVDMKGGLAAAAGAISRCGGALLMTADEEIGCLGAGEAAAEVDLGFVPKLVIIPEATDNAYSRGHRGVNWFEVVAHGHAGHASRPELAVNAIEVLYHELLAHMGEAPLAEDAYLGKDSLNLGTVQAGSSPNVVPDRAELVIDLRTVESGQHFYNWLQGLSPQLSVRELVSVPPLPASEVPEVMAEFVEAGPAPYATDGAMIQPLTTGAPTVIWGPGHPDQMHTVGEKMHLDSLEQAFNNYLRVLGSL